MKKMLTLVLLSANWAHAGYLCHSTPQGSELTVQYQADNHLGADVQMVLQKGSEQTVYWGKLQSEEGTLLEQELISIFPYNQNETLAITSMPEFCGRGSCLVSGKKTIQANLNVGDSNLFFFCDETND